MGSLWVIAHIMICHSYEESGQCVSIVTLFQTKHALILHRLLGLEGNSIDCGFLFLYCLFRVNRETTARQKVLQVPKVTEWVSYMYLFFLCCLLVVVWIVSLISIWTQGPPGDRGERGEPGDPGYIVSEIKKKTDMLFVVLCTGIVSVRCKCFFCALKCRKLCFPGSNRCWWKERWSWCPRASCKYLIYVSLNVKLIYRLTFSKHNQ